MIHSLLSEKLLYALGWTVLHSLWQAFVIGLVLALLLVFLQKRSARFRYLLSGFAMLTVLVWSMFTFWDLFQSEAFLMEEMAFFSASSLEQEGSLLQILYQNFSEYFNSHLPLIVTFWFIGVAFFMLRMLGGLAYIQHLKNTHNQPLSSFWQQKLNDLSDQIPLNKTIDLVESTLVKVPMVVGYLKPMILMPVGAINNLSIAQVEAILAHELAHIYRHDYLLNILQSLIETLFYFNPAIWWISANIRSERENCCDDIAVKVCGNSVAYAKALVSLQEMHQAAPVLAMPFSKNKNQLLNRVKRVLNQPQNKSNIMEKITATLMLFLAMIMLSFGANIPFENIWIQNEEVELDHLLVENLDTEEEILFVKPIERDTNPKGKTRIKKEKRGDIEIRMENGKVTELKVDGKEIPEEKYEEYEEEIGELKEIAEDMPEPPAPTAPPSSLFAPEAPTAPIAPILPLVKVFPTPPAPPSPPATMWRSKSKSRTITTEKNEGGTTTIIIEEESGKEPIEIKIEQDENGKITIDGEEIENLEEGDKMIIVEEYSDSDGSNSFFFKTDSNKPFIWNGEVKNFDENALFFPDKTKDKKKNKRSKSKKKSKNKEAQGNLWYFNKSEFNNLGKDLEAISSTPNAYYEEILNNASLALSPDVNLLYNLDEALVAPNIEYNENIDLLVNPEMHLNITSPFSDKDKTREYNNLIQQYRAEYKERKKDGNLSKKWREEWDEKIGKMFPNSTHLHLFNEYSNAPKIDLKGKVYDLYFGSDNKVIGTKTLPIPDPENIPNAYFLKKNPSKVE